MLKFHFRNILYLQLFIFPFLIFRGEGRKGFGGTNQEWGFVKVRPNARMFWWLYYTESKNLTEVYDKPLLIWLQGGPGGSSTGYGNFEEFGPLDLDLKPRNYTWVNDYNVLFIDNPVGTGYSYSENYSGFAKTNAQIASDLLECVRGFYEELPEWLKVPTYVTSESYGGKMAIDFALVWDKAQKEGNIKSNFRGVMLVDSWISPIDSVISWGSYLLETGMVDTEGFKKIEEAIQSTKNAVEKEQWSLATSLWAYTEQVIIDATGNIDFYNILTNVNYFSAAKSSLSKLILPGGEIVSGNRERSLDSLMNNEVKEALNLEKSVTWGTQSSQVFSILAGDFMKPVTNEVERLLNETKIEVFVITGQLDLIVATPGTVHWVENLKWKNAMEWRKAPRRVLTVKNVIEGYIKEYGKLKMYWVNRSGHMVPKDNPKATAAILRHLTAN